VVGFSGPEIEDKRSGVQCVCLANGIGRLRHAISTAVKSRRERKGVTGKETQSKRSFRRGVTFESTNKKTKRNQRRTEKTTPVLVLQTKRGGQMERKGIFVGVGQRLQIGGTSAKWWRPCNEKSARFSS